MHFARITRPTKTCVSVALLRSNERIGHTAENDNILLFIRAAEGLIEKKTARSIMRQTFRLTTDRIVPSTTLWYPPMEGEITIKSASSRVAGSAKEYAKETLVVSSRDMLPVVGFPTILRQTAGALAIEYDTGVDDETEVPPEIRQAVLLLAGHYYRNREAAQADSRVSTFEKKLPYGVDALISAYAIPNINAPFYEDS